MKDKRRGHKTKRREKRSANSRIKGIKSSRYGKISIGKESMSFYRFLLFLCMY